MYKCACDQTTTHTVNDSILPNLRTIFSTNVLLLSELFISYSMCMHVYNNILTLIILCWCIFDNVYMCVGIYSISPNTLHTVCIKVFYNVIYISQLMYISVM